MDVVGRILLVLHLLGWAIVLGGSLVNIRTPKIAPGMLHGALTALLTGLILAVLIAAEALEGGRWTLDWVLVLTKLVITLVITAMIWLGQRRPSVSSGFMGVLAGLTTLNVALALLWR